CLSDQGAPAPPPRDSTSEGAKKTAAFRGKRQGRLDGRIRAWAMPVSPETCSADLLRGVKSVADEHQTFLTLHHGSGPQARKDYQARHGKTPTEYLESLGVLGANVVLAHSLGVDDSEIECLALTGTTFALFP